MITDDSSTRPLVIFIHGFGGKRLWLLPLSHRVRQRFDVTHWSYHSIFGSIQLHAEAFRRFLDERNSERAIHIVCHSMGCIVVRSALEQGKVPNVRRIVMLAPPNRGTPVATIANHLFGRICRPLAELSDFPTSLVNRLPPQTNYPTGVIAARFDLLVPIEHTKLAGNANHRILNSTHNSVLFSKRAAEFTLRFLTTGNFDG